MTKQCARCKEHLPLDRFGVCRARKDGLRPYCRICNSARSREWAQNNIEKVRALDRARGKVRYPERRAYYKDYCDRNRASIREHNRKWAAQNREKARRSVLASVAKRLTEDPEYFRKKSRIRYEKNKDRILASTRAWAEKNKAHVRALTRARQAEKLKATPKWLTAIQKAQMREFYEIALARTVQTGIAHHVDHVVPLRGKRVRGLHVPWNLQVLTAQENMMKSAIVLQDLGLSYG